MKLTYIEPSILISIFGKLYDPSISNEWIPPHCKIVRIITDESIPRHIPIYFPQKNIEFRFETKETLYNCPTTTPCLVLTFPDEHPFFTSQGDGQIVFLESNVL